ncbi:hypothetical protein KM043_016784 [Ampulex compressa]|nr:hypothetical protein KM043_016784 [Ampulex compressa]
MSLGGKRRCGSAARRRKKASKWDREGGEKEGRRDVGRGLAGCDREAADGEESRRKRTAICVPTAKLLSIVSPLLGLAPGNGEDL